MTHDPLCLNAKGCSHDCGGCACNLDAFCQCVLIAKVRADEQERQVTRLREQGVTVYSLSVSDPSLLPTLP